MYLFVFCDIEAKYQIPENYINFYFFNYILLASNILF